MKAGKYYVVKYDTVMLSARGARDCNTLWWYEKGLIERLKGCAAEPTREAARDLIKALKDFGFTLKKGWKLAVVRANESNEFRFC